MYVCLINGNEIAISFALYSSLHVHVVQYITCCVGHYSEDLPPGRQHEEAQKPPKVLVSQKGAVNCTTCNRWLRAKWLHGACMLAYHRTRSKLLLSLPLALVHTCVCVCAFM